MTAEVKVLQHHLADVIKEMHLAKRHSVSTTRMTIQRRALPEAAVEQESDVLLFLQMCGSSLDETLAAGGGEPREAPSGPAEKQGPPEQLAGEARMRTSKMRAARQTPQGFDALIRTSLLRFNQVGASDGNKGCLLL